MRDDQYAIVCFWNDKNNIKRGAHFVAVSRDNSGEFSVYNDSKLSKTEKTTFDTNQILSGGQGKLITYLIIN